MNGQTCQTGQCAGVGCPNGQTDCGNGVCADVTADLSDDIAKWDFLISEMLQHMIKIGR